MSKLSMHSQSGGDGTPILLFVHGWCGDSTHWRYQRTQFEPSNRVVTCDLRGHGACMDAGSGFDIPTCGSDVARTLTTGESAPVVLVGHGMGCRVVLETARLAPDALAGVILIDGDRHVAGDPDATVRMARDRYAATGFGPLREALFESMFPDDTTSMHKAEVIDRARRVSDCVAEAFWCSVLRWDAAQMEGALRKLQVPLLVLQSTYLDSEYRRLAVDPRMMTPWLEVIGRLVPTVRIQTLGGASHFPMLDAPAAVNRCIATFLADATFRRFFESAHQPS